MKDPTLGSLPASPGQAYLDSLNRRMATGGSSPGLYVLTLPGVGLGKHYTALDLLLEVSLALYVGEDLFKERVLSRLPAWEAIELAELVCISQLMHGGGDLKPVEGFWKLGLRCGSLGMVVSTETLLLHYCSVFYHHATLLSEQLIPHLPFACEAVNLARALATAEQVLAQAGDKEARPGTVANPSPLLKRALALHVDALLRADEGMDISGLRGAIPPARGGDERIGQRLDATITEAKAAA